MREEENEFEKKKKCSWTISFSSTNENVIITPFHQVEQFTSPHGVKGKELFY